MECGWVGQCKFIYFWKNKAIYLNCQRLIIILTETCSMADRTPLAG